MWSLGYGPHGRRTAGQKLEGGAPFIMERLQITIREEDVRIDSASPQPNTQLPSNKAAGIDMHRNQRLLQSPRKQCSRTWSAADVEDVALKKHYVHIMSIDSCIYYAVRL